MQHLENVKQINIRVPEAINEELRELAFKKRTTKTELVNKYIREGLKRETKQTKLD